MIDHTLITRLAITTPDGIDLRAEIAQPSTDSNLAVNHLAVICHPHPLHGGTMFSPVVERLFLGLVEHQFATVRFNFRGTNGSTGRHEYGRGESLDAHAVVHHLSAAFPDRPLLMAGYSFGADIALATNHPSIAAWLAIAPPFRVVEPPKMASLNDPRPIHLVVGVHDDLAPLAATEQIAAQATNATVVPVDGADHFFAIGQSTILDTAIAIGNAGSDGDRGQA